MLILPNSTQSPTIRNMRATIAKIYTNNLRHNLIQIKNRLAPKTKMCVAVKANAYGHGAVECAKIALECGADFLAIAAISEGIELREAGIQAPLLLLSLCQPEEMDDLVENDITPFVFDADYADLVAAAVKKAGRKNYPVHLAIDTGMGRIGCYPEDAANLARHIISTGCLELGGMCTHFAVSDSPAEEDDAYTARQFARFTEAIENVKAAGINPGICHCCNSAATLEKPEYHLDMVRPGIIVYGYYPDGKPRTYYEEKKIPVDLKPVMALMTKVLSIRPIKKGMSVSYGHTWTAKEDTMTGVLPIGYADGLFRRLAPHLQVAVKGKAYPVRGRICMDQCMIDTGNDPVERWSDAVLFGPEESGAVLTAQELADATGTISYEITSAITKRVPRVFVNQ